MLNLKVPCLVEEEAIVLALREHAHKRMFGTEFSMGDVVRFQNLGGTNVGPINAQVGVVAEVTTESEGYRVWYVTDAGDIHNWKVKPHQLRPAEEA